MSVHPNPFFPANAGTQVQPEREPFLALHSLTIGPRHSPRKSGEGRSDG